jgi:uncharacterized protein involved in exopolysaccharide biosynthesis
MFLFVTLVGSVIGLSAAFVLTPIYRVEALLAPVVEEHGRGLSGLSAQFGDFAALAGVSLPAAGGTQDQAIAILKSRAFTERFIVDNELLPILFHDRWDAEADDWGVDDDGIPTIWEAFELFDERVRFVSEDKRTGLVTLSVEWKDPEVAADWAVEMIHRINSEMRYRAIQEADKSLRYLNDELANTPSVEVKGAIFKLIESQTKAMMLAKVREEYSFKVLDPPAVPDQDDPVRPRRLLLIGGGVTAGLLVALALALVRGRSRPRTGTSDGAAEGSKRNTD